MERLKKQIISLKCSHSISEHVASFLSTLRKSTQDTYSYVWNNWVKFCSEKEVDTFLANSYKTHLFLHHGIKDYEQISEVSVKGYIAVLKSIYDYLLTQGAVTQNPFTQAYRALKKAKGGKRTVHRALSIEEIKLILTKGFCGTREGIRDALWFKILFTSGLRISELLNLRLCDLRESGENFYLFLSQTKTEGESLQVLPDSLAKEIREFITQELKERPPRDPLFIHYKGHQRRISKQYIRRKLNYLGKEFNLGKIYPHDARCSVVTLALKKMLPSDVQLISRHRTLAMIDLYNRRNQEFENHPAKKFNPLA